MADPSELDELPEEAWAYWQALSLIDDWGGDRFAELAANIHNSLMMAVAKRGSKVEDRDIRRQSDYERRFKWERKRVKVMSGQAQLQFLKEACGL